MANVLDILQERGLMEGGTSIEETRQALAQPTAIYCGFDPTADSLHLGSLVPLIGLKWFEKSGHRPIAIVGGATGTIGDPSGKAKERQLLDEKTISSNLAGIQKNIEKFLDSPLILNNLDWFRHFSCISFLRDVGKMFRMGPMLSRESVRVRLESEDGMSFTEFCYQLLQGYDFLYLFEKYGVSLQLGGSDQWGNIVSGIELIRKMHGKPAFGVTFPLLTKSDGQKFGKSEQGTIWLSPEKLSPYGFYQYLVRIADADVIKLMKMITFLEMEEIHYWEKTMQSEEYTPTHAQKRLAEEVTRLVHGPDGLLAALRATEGLAPGGVAALDASAFVRFGEEVPKQKLHFTQVLGASLVDLLVLTRLLPSKSEARRWIRNGGVYLNNEKITNEHTVFSNTYLIGGQWTLLAIGKKNKLVLEFIK